MGQTKTQVCFPYTKNWRPSFYRCYNEVHLANTVRAQEPPTPGGKFGQDMDPSPISQGAHGSLWSMQG